MIFLNFLKELRMNKLLKLQEIINKILENKNSARISNLDVNSHLRNDIGFDSLDLAELTVRIEREFGVDIFEDGLVETVGDILLKIKDNNG